MHGDMPFQRDLGGSESAMVFAARALAARGHEVEVFTRCEAPGEYDDVVYHDISQLAREASIRDWDVFVSLRFPDLGMHDIRAGLRLLWCQDLLWNQPVEAWLAWYDGVVLVSEWHRDHALRDHPRIAERAFVVPNPVDLSLIPPSRVEDDPPLLVHLSRPERGLGPLLDAWPSIHVRYPGARLAVARYRSFHEPRGSAIEAFCHGMDLRVAETEGAETLGFLSKPDLYALLSRAALMVYPAEFDETSCIAAIEAQACGCPVVATRRGALPETLAPDAAALVEPGPDMRERFADKVVDLLWNPERRLAMSEAGRERASAHDVPVIAQRWEDLFREGLDRTTSDRAVRVFTGIAPPGVGFARWPGLGPKLLQAIHSRLGTDRVRILGPNPGLPGIDDGYDAVLDFGLPIADDPVAWLRSVAATVPSGMRVVSVIPWAAGFPVSHVPTASAIGAWFDGAESHGLSLEASAEWGVPARCWLVSWTAGRLSPEVEPPCRHRHRPTISACMIVRDAADTVLTALSSLQSCVDEIRVLDTGSQDDTFILIETFARRCPVPVILQRCEWPDDFAEARNRSVEGSEGDWILWLDADERLIGGERLRRWAESGHFHAFAIRQHNHIFDRATTQVEIPFRMYRNGRGYRFYGVVHEHPEKALNEPIEPFAMASGVDILHYGYLTEPGRMKKFLGRNLRLLNLDMERNPGRLLTDVLYLRDTVNLAWFDKRDNGVVRADHAAALRLAVDRFENRYLDARDRYYDIGRKYYDQALALLGEGVDLHIQVGGLDAERRTHRVRHASDAAWLAASAATRHFRQTHGRPR